jgi:hypothetical protein
MNALPVTAAKIACENMVGIGAKDIMDQVWLRIK